MRSDFLCAAVAASCVIFSMRCAMAQPADAPLTLQEAVNRTLERNLDLKSFERELAAQAGREQQARARPNPEVGLLLENTFGSGERSSLDAAEATLSLGFLLERGARERRIDLAQAGGSMLDTEGRIREFAAAGEGIATNILADRLAKLEAAGILTKRPDPADARRVHYRLTEKGIALAPALVEIVLWSARYEDTDAPASTVRAMHSHRKQFLADVRKRWSDAA